MKIGDEVDFNIKTIKDGKTTVKRYHGKVTWWSDYGVGSADCGKHGVLTFGSGNLVKHRLDPTEYKAYTIYDGSKFHHFHHRKNAIAFALSHNVAFNPKVSHYDKELADENGFKYDD